MACNEDMIPDLTTQKPPPRTVPYQPPSFNLDRPTRHLMKEERIEVHHNYISAVSNLEHKKDLINRLKWSKPHNIPTYEAEMTCHMSLHNDVLGRMHTILKQDDYFRALEELPVIDGLHAYDDIQLFSELFESTLMEDFDCVFSCRLFHEMHKFWQPKPYCVPKVGVNTHLGNWILRLIIVRITWNFIGTSAYQERLPV